MGRKSLYGLAALLLGSCSPQRENLAQESGQTTRPSYQQPGHKCIETPPELDGIYKGMSYIVEICDGESTIVEIRSGESSYVKAYVHKDKSKDYCISKSEDTEYVPEPIRKVAYWSGLEKQ